MSVRRTLLLTGATAGIGREAAFRLASAGTTLILPARDRNKGRALAAALQRHADDVTVDVPACDFTSLADVRRLAAHVSARYDRLDVLALNAGVVTRTRQQTADGYELQFGVNHLAPFLLATLLQPLLIASAPARIVITASKVHFDGHIDFDDLQGERDYQPDRAYQQSKLANVCVALTLARRLAGTGVSVNCLHPGVYATTLLGDLFAVPRLLRFRLRRNFPGPEAGGAALQRLMTDESLSQVTGAYFDEFQEALPSAEARDEGVQERLWAVSAGLVA